jgi:hypothetical protein
MEVKLELETPQVIRQDPISFRLSIMEHIPCRCPRKKMLQIELHKTKVLFNLGPLAVAEQAQPEEDLLNDDQINVIEEIVVEHEQEVPLAEQVLPETIEEVSGELKFCGFNRTYTNIVHSQP